MVERSTNCVRFFRHWVKNNFQSERQGRLVGEEVAYIEIRAAGSKLNVTHRKATPKDQQDYPFEWEAYQSGKAQMVKGTPLSEWEVMTEGTVAMLKALNIHTLETLAELSDAGLQNIGIGARQLQDGARLFLEQAASKPVNPPAESADLRAENKRLEAKIEQQGEKIKKQAKKIAALKPKKAA